MGKKKKRSGVLVGAYIPATMKADLKRMAAERKQTLSEFLRQLYMAAIKGEK